MRLTWSPRARYLALAVAAAVISGVLAYTYLSGVSRRVRVVVASRDFGCYAVLDSACVKLALVPAAAAHPLALSRLEDAVGKVSLVSRTAGEQVVAPSLVSGENPGEYRASLGPEERALFLPAGSVLGGWLGVERGDYVDLIVVLEGVSRCLGQGFEVLEVVRDDEGQSILGGRMEPPAGVLLRATPGAAEEIALALEYGQVYYAVAGYAGVPIPTSGAWIEQLRGGGESPDGPTWP